MDGVPTTGVYTSTPNTAGYDFGNNKAVVVHLDNSASLDTLTATSGATGNAITYTDMGYDPNSSSTTKINILLPSANTSLTGCQLVAPNGP